MERLTWIAAVIVLVSVSFGVMYIPSFMNIVLMPPQQCPVNCNDYNPCTVDYCGPEEYICLHEKVPECCGNSICEEGEYPNCGDCPSCIDGNRCTRDSYNYKTKRCVHERIEQEILLQDDFDSDSEKKWINVTDWTLSKEGRNKFMNVSTTVKTLTVIPITNYTITRDNYSLSVRVKVKSGSAIIDFRRTPSRMYRLNITDSKFMLKRIVAKRRELLTAFDSVQKNEWTRIRVAAIGKNIIVMLNGNHFFTYKDDYIPITSGSIGLGVSPNPKKLKGEVLFDDVVVKKADMSNYEC